MDILLVGFCIALALCETAIVFYVIHKYGQLYVKYSDLRIKYDDADYRIGLLRTRIDIAENERDHYRKKLEEL